LDRAAPRRANRSRTEDILSIADAQAELLAENEVRIARLRQSILN